MIHYNYAARHEAVWEIRGGMNSSTSIWTVQMLIMATNTKINQLK